MAFAHLWATGECRGHDSYSWLGRGFSIRSQFAKKLGARVIATTSSEVKAQQLKELGADDVINFEPLMTKVTRFLGSPF